MRKFSSNKTLSYRFVLNAAITRRSLAMRKLSIQGIIKSDNVGSCLIALKK